MKMQTILNFMLNLIVPPRCPISGEMVNESGELSPEVWGQLQFIVSPFCASCGVPFSNETVTPADMVCASCLLHAPQYDCARSAVVYDDLSKQLVLRFKHGDHLYLLKCFQPWLEHAGADIIDAADCVIPVPLHWTRMLKRRYNQAGILARAIADKYKLSFEPQLLKRVKATAPQGVRKVKDRKQNVSKAFHCPSPDQLKGKAVLLIDDVMTSGATVDECAKVLKQAGARAVYVLSIARAVKD